MRTLATVVAFALLHTAPARADAPSSKDAAAEINAFNDAFAAAIRSMSNGTVLALWDDDGTALLPHMAPIVGKKAIGAFLDEVMGQLKGAQMKSYDHECAGLEVAGRWASEYCTEHQVVALPGGKPPFDGWGKMLLVLRRGDDGKWRLHREMWNEADPPKTKSP